MSASTIDWDKPFTDDELRKLTDFFRTLPTYTDDGVEPYFLSTDVENCLRGFNYYHGPEQCEAYKNYWDKHYGGKIHLSRYVDVVKGANAGPSAMSSAIGKAWDRDGDGHISASEFAEFLDFMMVHEPKLKGYDYEQFMEEADANKDGKISIEEFAQWIKAKVPK